MVEKRFVRISYRGIYGLNMTILNTLHPRREKIVRLSVKKRPTQMTIEGFAPFCRRKDNHYGNILFL